ncbi:MAG: HAMP domain-containing histidine kinase [Chthoniobacterales bacterium]|nr:HAMP domain-containing histidine kinase [Chthoniobacterales bacterium]
MNLRFKLAAWFALSFVLLAGLLVVTAHTHLDEELRKDRWDRSHPKFPGWIIHGSYTDEEVHDILGELLRVWVWVGVPAVLGSLAVGYLIARRSMQPVARINREMDALQTGDLRRGVTVPDRDLELSALVSHLNGLLRRVADSFEQMSDFSAQVAHELRTPLSILRLRLEAAAPELPPDFSEEMEEELHRLSRLVERSLLMARAEGQKLDVDADSVDLSSLMEELRDSYAVVAREKSTELQWCIPSGLQCFSDPDLLRQILHNLLDNAAKHGREAVRVSAYADGQDRVIVKISNFAPPEGAPSSGVGIGLRLSNALASALQGTGLRLRSTHGGFFARLTVPRQNAACDPT